MWKHPVPHVCAVGDEATRSRQPLIRSTYMAPMFLRGYHTPPRPGRHATRAHLSARETLSLTTSPMRSCSWVTNSAICLSGTCQRCESQRRRGFRNSLRFLPDLHLRRSRSASLLVKGTLGLIIKRKTSSFRLCRSKSRLCHIRTAAGDRAFLPIALVGVLRRRLRVMERQAVTHDAVSKPIITVAFLFEDAPSWRRLDAPFARRTRR
jgi:hypothetical protein